MRVFYVLSYSLLNLHNLGTNHNHIILSEYRTINDKYLIKLSILAFPPLGLHNPQEPAVYAGCVTSLD